jgi:hypothetical protein
MAYLNQDDEENQGQGLNQTLGQPNQQGQAPTGEPQPQEPQPQQSSGGSTIGGGNTAQPSVPMPKQGAQKAGTGTFTNLKNYLQANQGNRVASAASQRVQNVATGAQKGVGHATNVFGQRVEQGSLANMGNALTDVKDTLKAATSKTYQAPNTQVQANTAGPQQPQVDRFGEVINAQYKGPQSLQDAGLYNPAAEKVRVAAQTGKQTQTASGRQDLLSDIYGRQRDYSRGQNQLDSLLLNTSAEGVAQLQQKGQQATATQGALEQAQMGSGNLATQRTKDIETIRSGARKEFTDTQKAQNTAVANRITAMTTAPALDAQGKQIQKRDAAGKPMVDATGKPIMLTQWETLPQHFKNAIIDKEKNNAAMISKQLKEFEAGNKQYADPKYAKTLEADKKNLNQLIYQRKLAEMGPMQLDGMSNTLGSYQAPTAEQLSAMDAEIAKLQGRVDTSSKAYEGYSKNREAITGQSRDQLRLSPEEAAMLGISEGTGLYNLNADAIKVGKADKTKLISKDELTRLQALQNLAKLDTGDFGPQLDQRIMRSADGTYDIKKAGTQSALDALDRAGTQAQFKAAEKAFKEQAKESDVTGFGSKKNKTSGKRYYAQETANMAKVLKNAGYDFKTPEGKPMSKEQVAKMVKGISSGDVDPSSLMEQSGIKGMTDAFGGSSGQGLGQDVGNVIGGGTGLSAITNAFGLGNFGNAVGGLFGGGSSSKESKSDAALFARRDLQKKMGQAIEDTGFYNRANIEDNKSTQARANALRKILGKLDKTNR